MTELKRNLKRNISLIITAGVILLIALLQYYTSLPIVQTPKAKAGVLDLSSWNFEEDGVVLLNGEWRFYPQRLAGPAGLDNGQPVYIRVPGPWKDGDGYRQPVRGEGTYRLTVQLPPLTQKLALKVQNVLTSHRLYVNGNLVKEMGAPGEEEGGHVPRNIPYQLSLDPSRQLDIVIQVSNRVSFDGGLNVPLLLGTEEAVTMKSQLTFGLDLAVIIMFLLFGLYHLQMYQMRDEDAGYLYSGLYLILLSFITAASGEKVLMRLLDGWSFYTLYRIQDMSLASSFLVMVMFICSLEPAVIKKKYILILIAPVLVYAGLTAVAPYAFYIQAKSYLTGYASILMLTCSFRLMYILHQKRANRQAAGELSCVVASFVFLTLLQLDSVLYYSGYVNSSLTGRLATIGFMLALNQLMARRYTNRMNEVQLLSEQLQQSNEIKDEFLARTSHELQIPLQGILNISGYILKEDGSPLTVKQRENMSLIQDTSAKLAILVHDLIDATKLRHEDIQLELKTVDLYVAVQIVFRLLSFDTEGRDIRLMNKISPMTFVEADENRLRQILFNLAAHAVRHTADGAIVAKTAVADGQVTMSLTGAGPTIPEEQWEELFRDTYRNPRPAGADPGGTGLGLFISRQLARRMGGDIWLAPSAPEEGPMFIIRLPLGLHPVEGMKEIGLPDYGTVGNHPPAATAGAGDKRHAKTILLVDDEPAQLHLLSLILADDYELITAHSGEAAFRQIQNNHIDLVIADMMMPGMSGVELTERIRQTQSVIELPIIMATLRADKRDVELAYQAGANDYITKPYTREEVEPRVRSLLQLTEAVRSAIRNEWAFLQAQIKPHFIYNALSNIVALCYEDGIRAGELLSRLSRYLRYIFEGEKTRDIILLQQEMEVIGAYVEIEQLRFGGRLFFETYLDPALEEAGLEIPALLIQPLIENAIRHGLFNKAGMGLVSLSVTEGDGFIRIAVEDDGVGMSEDQVYHLMHGSSPGGVGIANIRRRVKAIPGASFIIHSELEKGTVCTLYLPRVQAVLKQ